MPSGSYLQVFVLCPFYASDDGAHRIVCEGIVDESSLALWFSRRADYETQMSVFCCQHYEKCEIYRMLMESKYEEEGDNHEAKSD